MTPAQKASPTGSEFEIDISSALAAGNGTKNSGNGFDSDDSGDGFEIEPSSSRTKKPKLGPLDASSILDLEKEIGDSSDDGDGDEEFIKSKLQAANRKTSKLKGAAKKSGGFQSMGLNATLLKAITRKGFSVPTPIQRKTIPLLLEGLDVVGMARTGSGKTAAFVIPMIEKLKAHSAKIGARALILSPSRELALQTLKVCKEFGKGTDLKCVLLVGGDSLEDQFSLMAGNPDIVIATPGRFLHLQVEMTLDLRSIQYVVFDEADRLFEMGFSSQLTEILHALPDNRQTLLFSATLPKSLVEFAKAGLHEPSLVRLDADSKISTDLESAFFTVQPSEKEGALLQILQDIIGVPMGTIKSSRDDDDEDDEDGEGNKQSAGRKKRKRTQPPKNELSSTHSTIIFTATKHHVEYVSQLLTTAGYPVAYVYGSLDQVARRQQVARFRSGEAHILVVTDVAARGIDIPMLSNVINYDFPPQPKVFIHRVGRTARAGRRGWAYSLVQADDIPYLLDLQLFLGRKLVFAKDSELTSKSKEDFDFAGDVIAGRLPREGLDRCCEAYTRLLGQKGNDLAALKEVMRKGEKLYKRTRIAAAAESIKRAKEIVRDKSWMCVNPLFADGVNNMELERQKMLARVSRFRPTETVFEIGQRGLNRSEAAEVMRNRRAKIKIDPSRGKNKDEDEDGDLDMEVSNIPSGAREEGVPDVDDEMDWEDESEGEGENGAVSVKNVDMSSADESELEDAFQGRQITSSKSKKGKDSSSSRPSKRAKTGSFQDPEHYMSYNPSFSLAEERAYGVSSGSGASFAEAARSATLDLTADESKSFAEASRQRSGMRWDSKAKKFVNRRNDFDGSREDKPKMIRSESGQLIASSFKSGRFDAWKKSKKISRLPRVGEAEKATRNIGDIKSSQTAGQVKGRGGRMFHKKVQAPKAADKARDDYHVRKKRVDEAKEKGLHGKGYGKKLQSEIRGSEEIRKMRQLQEKRREKNARPSKKTKAMGRKR